VIAAAMGLRVGEDGFGGRARRGHGRIDGHPQVRRLVQGVVGGIAAIDQQLRGPDAWFGQRPSAPRAVVDVELAVSLTGGADSFVAIDALSGEINLEACTP
jgi:hypothetical protein